jgi:hypothetical protein
MDFDELTFQMKTKLEARFDSVELLGTDRAKFLRISKGNRHAVTCVDEEGWLVEWWSDTEPPSNEENLVKDEMVQTQEEAMDRICAWLNEK